MIEIGTGVDTSVPEVAKPIIKLIGGKSEIAFRPMRTGEKKIHTKSLTRRRTSVGDQRRLPPTG